MNEAKNWLIWVFAVVLFAGAVDLISNSIADEASKKAAQGYEIAVKLTVGHAVHYVELQPGHYVVDAVIQKDYYSGYGTAVLRQIVPTDDIIVLVDEMPLSMMDKGYQFGHSTT